MIQLVGIRIYFLYIQPDFASFDRPKQQFGKSSAEEKGGQAPTTFAILKSERC